MSNSEWSQVTTVTQLLLRSCLFTRNDENQTIDFILYLGCCYSFYNIRIILIVFDVRRNKNGYAGSRKSGWSRKELGTDKSIVYGILGVIYVCFGSVSWVVDWNAARGDDLRSSG